VTTYIRFGDDHYIAVQEEFAEVRQRIEESESSQMPLFEATRVDGTRMLLNANEIRTISEGKKKDGGGKS
jgi:uncharacterized protein YlzI (FlbEa/FlbD family)